MPIEVSGSAFPNHDRRGAVRSWLLAISLLRAWGRAARIQSGAASSFSCTWYRRTVRSAWLVGQRRAIQANQPACVPLTQRFAQSSCPALRARRPHAFFSEPVLEHPNAESAWSAMIDFSPPVLVPEWAQLQSGDSSPSAPRNQPATPGADSSQLFCRQRRDPTQSAAKQLQRRVCSS